MECPVVYVGPELYQTLDIFANVSTLLFSYRISVMTIIHRTLQRLGRMRHLIETQPFRPRQRLAILTKLEQHEAKLADLASKYSVRRLVFIIVPCMVRATADRPRTDGL